MSVISTPDTEVPDFGPTAAEHEDMQDEALHVTIESVNRVVANATRLIDACDAFLRDAPTVPLNVAAYLHEEPWERGIETLARLGFPADLAALLASEGHETVRKLRASAYAARGVAEGYADAATKERETRG